MDSLVSKYSRPAYQQNEPLDQDEAQDLMDPMANLSLKFAMPPVAQVSPSKTNPNPRRQTGHDALKNEATSTCVPG